MTNGNSSGRLQRLLFLGAIGLGVFLCYKLALPFLPALTWAFTLAIIFFPLHRQLEAKLKRPTVAALITVLAAAIIVVVPLGFLGNRFITEAINGIKSAKDLIDSGRWQHVFDNHPHVESLLTWAGQKLDVTGAINSFASWLTAASGTFLMATAEGAVAFLLTFYMLFFFLRDHHLILSTLRDFLPLTKSESDHLITRVGDTVYATFYGSLIMAAIQGALGGLMFWWLGLPTPLFWGTVMTALSLIPVLGAFIVWMPAVAFLALSGSWIKALILLAWGLLVVGTVDNLLYPILVGKKLKVHTLFAFISLVGGLAFFGASGLILGPVTLTVTLFLIETWRKRSEV